MWRARTALDKLPSTDKIRASSRPERRLGSVIKKRRKKMRKHKYKKLRARNRHKRKR